MFLFRGAEFAGLVILVWCSVQETAIRLESSGMHIGRERTAFVRSWRLSADLVGLRRTFTLASGYSPSGSFLVQVTYPIFLFTYLR